MSDKRPISDADLQSHLRRRSDDGSTRDDAWNRAFRGGVDSRIAATDDTPRRSMPFAWAGVAAALALVLVVVVVPRVTAPAGTPAVVPPTRAAVVPTASPVSTPAATHPATVVSGSGRVIECAPESASPYNATLHDETGLVESCAGSSPESIDPTVLNVEGDLRRLQVNWDGRPCDAEATVTVSRLDDGYYVHGVLKDDTCRSAREPHALVITLNEDVNADLVLSQFDRHTPIDPTSRP